ncbi:hypothetical protein ACTL6P_19215 [Endozoicomonas acroporae]|uniref:hypothetical protein n=1 Tax=Endozoicomonas acroporae TaxID=1701104 RepID=UPI0011AED9E8|nr:hypothetical protein [Endozoicomonas acroporae]
MGKNKLELENRAIVALKNRLELENRFLITENNRLEIEVRSQMAEKKYLETISSYHAGDCCSTRGKVYSITVQPGNRPHRQVNKHKCISGKVTNDATKPNALPTISDNSGSISGIPGSCCRAANSTIWTGQNEKHVCLCNNRPVIS